MADEELTQIRGKVTAYQIQRPRNMHRLACTAPSHMRSCGSDIDLGWIFKHMRSPTKA